MMNSWSRRIAGENTRLRQILDDVPGPMCNDINAAIGKADLLKRHYFGDDNGEDFDNLYAMAETLQEERDAAVSMLEDCRSGLAALRTAVEDLAADYTEVSEQLVTTCAELSAAADREASA